MRATGDHIFGSEWFKVEAIRCIVVGRHCFRIAVNHNGLNTCFAQCIGCVHAAIVEFYTLANAVGPPPKIITFLRSVGVASLEDGAEVSPQSFNAWAYAPSMRELFGS